ncbi:MAG: AsmA family protein, partial [Pseudolabrys sp.]
VFAAGGAGARLDATLSAPEIEIDSLRGFANAVLDGSAVERPSDVELAVDIGRATAAGFEARKISARARLGGGGRLDIAKLAVEDLGGASISASGEIALTPAPQGDLRLDIDARDLTAVTALLSKSLPSVAGALQRAAPMLAPAKLRASISLDGATPVNHAALAVDGVGGAIRVNLRGQASAEPTALNAATIRLQSKLEAADGGSLTRMLGLDRLVTVGKEPGTLMLTMSGPAFGDLQVVSHVKAGGLAASVNGTLRPLGPAVMSGSIYANIERADFAPLLSGRYANAGGSLPVALTTKLTFAAGGMSFDELSAVVAGDRVRGAVSVGLERPHRLSGELNAETINLTGLVAAGIGMPSGGGAAAQAAWAWPGEPFSGALAGDLDGEIALKATRAGILPGLMMRELRTGLRFSGGGIALADLSGQLAGGNISGQASFQPNADGIAMKIGVKLDGADAEALLPGATRAPVSGKLAFEAQIEGNGRSPATLIGSLRGAGKLSLSQGQLSALNPRAFDAAIRAVDNGLPADAGKLATLTGNALDSGQLPVQNADADFVINAGQMRLDNATVKGEGADASLSGGVDLTDGTLDLRLVLSGPASGTAARPDVFLALRGPVSAPTRKVDVSALRGWLTMRAIERQSKRIEQIEAAPRPAAPPRKPAAPAAAEPLSLNPQN